MAPPRRRAALLAGACLCGAACIALQGSLRPSGLLAAVPPRGAAGQATDAQRQAQVETYQQAARVYAIIHQQHKNTIVTVIGLLAIKIAVLHVLTVRARLMVGNSNRSANRDKPWEEDTRMPAWYMKILQCVCFAFGPAPSEAFLLRCQGLVANSQETEPWFMGLAVAYGLRGVTNIYAARHAQNLMWAFLVARALHAGIYLAGVRQPFRAACWKAATFSMVFLAVVALI
uniref:Glutathione transferase n=1 Tax=Zooxanthella nutricula TaxID=1333877 RepID=A0A6U6X3Z1_9DINO